MNMNRSDQYIATYPNSITEYCGQFGINWDRALDLLQCHGIMSDNCISLDEVAEADCSAAIRCLEETGKHLKERLL
jgi:hypothetical protein